MANVTAQDVRDAIEKAQTLLCQWEQGMKAQLAEAEVKKPELRHGDYGLDKDGFFFLREDGFLWTKYYEAGKKNCTSRSLNKTGNNSQLRVWASQIRGNIFDELKARQEPLKKFTMKETTAASEFSGSINKWTVYLKNHCHGNEGIQIYHQILLFGHLLSLFVLKVLLDHIQCTEDTKSL